MSVGGIKHYGRVDSMQPMVVVPPVESQASMAVADCQICCASDPAVPKSGDFQLDENGGFEANIPIKRHASKLCLNNLVRACTIVGRMC